MESCYARAVAAIDNVDHTVVVRRASRSSNLTYAACKSNPAINQHKAAAHEDLPYRSWTCTTDVLASNCRDGSNTKKIKNVKSIKNVKTTHESQHFACNHQEYQKSARMIKKSSRIHKNVKNSKRLAFLTNLKGPERLRTDERLRRGGSC